MHIAILTFEGFNELDSLIALGILNRVKQPNWRVSIASPAARVPGVAVLDKPFFARGNVATAGGCLASQYLASWVIARLAGIEAARSAMHYVAPVGEKDQYILRTMQNITQFLDATVQER